MRWVNVPSFRPSICKPRSLRWVAVVDLMRVAGSPMADPEKATIRLRLRSPASRSFRRQEKAKAELLDAVAAELLNNHASEQAAVAA